MSPLHVKLAMEELGFDLEFNMDPSLYVDDEDLSDEKHH